MVSRGGYHTHNSDHTNSSTVSHEKSRFLPGFGTNRTFSRPRGSMAVFVPGLGRRRDEALFILTRFVCLLSFLSVSVFNIPAAVARLENDGFVYSQHRCKTTPHTHTSARISCDGKGAGWRRANGGFALIYASFIFLFRFILGRERFRHTLGALATVRFRVFVLFFSCVPFSVSSFAYICIFVQ